MYGAISSKRIKPIIIAVGRIKFSILNKIFFLSVRIQQMIVLNFYIQSCPAITLLSLN